MRRIISNITDSHADRVTPFERRVLQVLEDATGAALNTRLIALKVFNYDPPMGATIATRAALRSLEWSRIVKRVVQGEGRGQSIWTLRAIFISEREDGKRAFFTA